jgi:hypothetical protein
MAFQAGWIGASSFIKNEMRPASLKSVVSHFQWRANLLLANT